jgi:aminocarboxymuconate-semialdehyde decarboxylase
MTATQVRTKKIDADTHYTLPIDYKELKDLLPRSQYAAAQDMMWRDAERWADPNGVRQTLTGEGGGARGGREGAPDPGRDIEARIEAMEKLGFDMQVLNTQRALPAPLRPADRPLWLRTALAKLYNNAAADLQNKHPDRFLCHATFPWDDIEESVREIERAHSLGLRMVTICGSWGDQNLDAYELYPFWEACSALDMACMVHNHTQPCGGTILDHTTAYPMVGTERMHRLHIGTYVGFGLDYTISCAALSLGGVLDEFPNLRFLFFEAGGGWMNYAMYGCDRSFYIERACSRTNTPPSELIKRHCYTAVESLEPLPQYVEAYGSENYLIGTDFPHPEFQRLPNATTDITDRPGLTDQDKANILGGNMMRALKLS